VSEKPARLTHYDASGRVRQVDVGPKPESERRAEARGFVRLSAEAMEAVSQGRVAKGDPLEVARIAGIMAAKRTAEIIPLCHAVPLTQVEVTAELDEGGIRLGAVARAHGKTGVEMEALTAVAAAALTVHDMLKSVDRSMVIEDVRLVAKSGGKSGDYKLEE
jgi:cyclic pyranopterin phosphate synthase